MYYTGIDISKKSLVVAVLDDEGELVKSPVKLTVAQKGLAQLDHLLESISTSKATVTAGIEATGNLWENVYAFLEEKGYRVVLINPYQSRRFHELAQRKAKTDKVDAIVIAGLLRSGQTRGSYVAEEEVQVLRELVRLRFALQKTKKNYQRRAMALLQLVFPEYTELVDNPFGLVSSMILCAYPTASHMREANVSDLVKLSRRIQGNNYSGELASKLICAAKNSIYSGRAAKVRGMNLTILLEEIQALREKIQRLEGQLDEILTPKEPFSPEGRLLQIPGVGPRTVATFLGEVGDITRFSSHRELIGFIGWYPNISESGEKKNPHPKMSRKGSAPLRAALYMAAVASLKHNKEMKTLYLKKRSQGKVAKQALVCVSKKLACIMYSMLKYESCYDPQRVFVQI
jgi:transposase